MIFELHLVLSIYYYYLLSIICSDMHLQGVSPDADIMHVI
jgi:hypothetical protein